MHHRIVAHQIRRGDLANVFCNLSRKSGLSVAKPSVAIEPSIEPGQVMTTLEQHRRKHCADIAICSGNKHLHSVSGLSCALRNVEMSADLLTHDLQEDRNMPAQIACDQQSTAQAVQA